MGYTPHHILSDRAVPTNDVWRVVCVLLLVTVLSVALGYGWGLLLTTAFGDMVARGAVPGFNVLFALSSFLMILFALAIALALLHRRMVWSLIGRARDTLRDGGRVLGVMAVILGAALVWPAPEGLEPERNLAFGTWAVWLPLAVVVLVIQIGTEELIFRGYLQSQLAARFRSPLIWLVIPAVLFALLHYNPMQEGNRWAVIGVTGVFALAAGDLTARTGNLGAALAMHFANNFVSLLLMGAAGPMAGLALYTIPVDPGDPSMLPHFAVEAGLIFVCWLAARLVLRR